jgi:hypothetical protein
MLTNRWLSLTLSATAALVCAPSNAIASLYIDLGNFLPTGINNKGQIVGFSGSGQILVRDSDGTTQVVGTGEVLGTTQGSIPGVLGAGINDHGEVVWNTSQGAVIRQPDGTVNPITMPVGNSRVTGINDSDKIVGFAFGIQPLCGPFQFNCSFVADVNGGNATFFQLALETFAFAINDNEQTTGTTHNTELAFERDADGASKLFKYCSTLFSCNLTFQDIGLAINNWGQIAGAEGASILCSAFPGYCPPGVVFSPAQGFVMDSDGSFTIFNYPGASRTILTGINDDGDLVGQYFMTDGSRGGFFITAVHH